MESSQDSPVEEQYEDREDYPCKPVIYDGVKMKEVRFRIPQTQAEQEDPEYSFYWLGNVDLPKPSTAWDHDLTPGQEIALREERITHAKEILELIAPDPDRMEDHIDFWLKFIRLQRRAIRKICKNFFLY